jgi:hypothetical protein
MKRYRCSTLAETQHRTVAPATVNPHVGDSIPPLATIYINSLRVG